MPETALPPIFVQLEGVVAERRPWRPGGRDGGWDLLPDLDDGLRRLAQVGEPLVLLVEPPETADQGWRGPEPLDDVRAALTHGGPELIFMGCPHTPDQTCDCRRPGAGLIEMALDRHHLSRGGWLICADQESVQAGRTAGLHTIRVGPLTQDHRAAVHRADYEARDLRDAANWILMQSLAPMGEPA